MPVFLGLVRLHSAFEIGQVMLVTGVAQLLTAPIAVQVERRCDPTWLSAFGFALFGIGLAMSYFQTWETDFDQMLWPQVVRGVAIMFCLLPPTRLALGHLAPERVPNASGLFNLMRNLGGAIGIALIDTVIWLRAPEHVDSIVQTPAGRRPRDCAVRRVAARALHRHAAGAGRCGHPGIRAAAGGARRPGLRHQRGLGDDGDCDGIGADRRSWFRPGRRRHG